MPGYLDPGQRRALTAATDVAVFPYRNSPAFQGSGAITDYLAPGVPVVATDVANMADLIGDGDDAAGDVVPPGDPADLARALDRYSDQDHQTKRRLGLVVERMGSAPAATPEIASSCISES